MIIAIHSKHRTAILFAILCYGAMIIKGLRLLEPRKARKTRNSPHSLENCPNSQITLYSSFPYTYAMCAFSPFECLLFTAIVIAIAY